MRFRVGLIAVLLFLAGCSSRYMGIGSALKPIARSDSYEVQVEKHQQFIRIIFRELSDAYAIINNDQLSRAQKRDALVDDSYLRYYSLIYPLSHAVNILKDTRERIGYYEYFFEQLKARAKKERVFTVHKVVATLQARYEYLRESISYMIVLISSDYSYHKELRDINLMRAYNRMADAQFSIATSVLTLTTALMR